jgi:hypothetical protein
MMINSPLWKQSRNLSKNKKMACTAGTVADLWESSR